MTTLGARVVGLGLWTPCAPSVAAWLEPGAAVEADPPAALLGPRLRRRTSLLTRLACEALEQAVRQAGADPARVATVFASAWGELQTTVALLEMMTVDAGTLSPALFHNSVQNTAAGYASIATQNRAPSTTVAAGPATTAMGLLEAVTLLLARGGDVALVVADEPLPPPFGGGAEPGAPLAVGFLLRAAAGGPRLTLARGTPTLPATDLPAALAASPAAPALRLLDALARGARGRVALEPGVDPRWCAEVSP